jgi:hypothetical protein
MPSPFPGMNPYLEHPTVWEDFHDRFLVYAAEALSAQALPDFLVRLGEHVFIREPDDPDAVARHADLSAVPSPATPPRPAAAAATLTAPVVGALPADYERDRLTYLEVRDRQDRRVVAVVELLSPTNKKAGPERAQFEAKRRALLAGEANYVEIDLLRGWRRMPVKGLPACDYYAMVSRPDDRPAVGLWPFGVRDPLQPVPVPLVAGRELTLDIRAALDRVYDAAGYHFDIYGRPPSPRLSDADAAWAREVLTAAGVTPAG